MKKKLYAIYDKKVGVFATPFFCNNVVDAMRNMEVAVADVQSSLHRFADDYAVYFVCDFDTETGILDTPAIGKPEFVEEVSTFKKGQKNA